MNGSQSTTRPRTQRRGLLSDRISRPPMSHTNTTSREIRSWPATATATPVATT